MAHAQLRLLGGIDLAGVARADAIALHAQSKVVALLAYLALAPAGRFQRRDKIVGLLWPDLGQAAARAALRKAVMAVRTHAGRDALQTRGDEELLLDRGVVSCDATTFSGLIDENRLAEALDLYVGELMPGFYVSGCADFDAWLSAARAELAQRASAAAWALAVQLEKSADLTRAGAMARRSVRYDWSDERVLRRTLQMLVRIGDRAGAIKLYEDCARRLRAELETEPGAETRELVDTLRRA